MCGIAGWYNHQEMDEKIISSIKSDLFHRGPDFQDHIIFEHAGLIHTRLSILDLSAKGNQPIANDDETIYTVFNGEIYNYPSLKKNLIAKGYDFKSTTDSEVIPKLFEEHGTTAFDLLEGMFAFSIYDSRKNELFLVRDRLGIKPLFYSISNNSLFFSSEIKALLNFPIKDRSINEQSIYDFASLNYIPAPATFFNSIQSLLPGEYLKMSLESSDCKLEKKSYFSLQIKPDFTLDQEASITTASKLLDRAVASQLESDVNLGSFLSAGIDSPLVADSASKHIQESSKGTLNLSTYTVELDDKKYNESREAKEISKSINSVHNNILMNKSMNLQSIKTFLLSTGQPYADVSMFGVNLIAKAMKNNITVALSGDGADEVFGGYYFFHRFEKKLLINEIFIKLPFLTKLFQLFAKSSIKPLSLFSQKVLRNTLVSDDRILADFFTWITKEERDQLLKNSSMKSVDRFFNKEQSIIIDQENRNRTEIFSARLTEICFRLQLPNDFLFKVDFATMKESLEVRVPMLDERLVEFGLSLPHRLKTRRKQGKYLLREIFRRRYLEYASRKLAKRRKTGFFIPIFQLLDQESKKEMQDYLLHEDSYLKRYFNYDIYSSWVQDFFNNKNIKTEEARASQRILMLLSLSLFLDQYE